MPHIAYFGGNNNSIKSKTLLLLHHYKNQLNNNTGLTLMELHKLTGCNYESLKASMSKWVRWHYILRHNGQPYRYIIAARGIRFVEQRIPLDIFNRYVSEINNHLSNIKNDG